MKKSTKKQKAPTARDLMKLEIADELGLLSKVRSVGWEGLTAQEAGTVGGVMSHRLRRAEKKASQRNAHGRNSVTNGEQPLDLQPK